MTPQELKNSILQLAIQGKLVEQRPEEGTAEELFAQIQEEKQRLIAEKKIKKEKPLPEITEDEKPFDIPESWKFIRTGSLCQLLDGEKIKGQNYPYLEAKYLRGKKEPSIVSEGKFVKEGTKVILVDGENSGEVFEVREDGYLGSTFKVLFIPSNVLVKYILCFLECNKNILKNNKRGAAIPHLDKQIFFNLLIPLPPFDEQKRIVAKIEKLLPYIDRYEQAWSQLEHFNSRFPEDMKKSLLQYAIQGKLVEQRPEEGTAEELFAQIQEEKQRLIAEKKIKKEKSLPEITEDEKPFDIPDSWKWVKIGELFTVIRGSSPRPKGSPLYWTEDKTEFNWITIKDISTHSSKGVLYETIEHLTAKGAELSTYVEKGEIIVAVSESTTGKHCILGIDGYIYDGLAAILNPTKIIFNKYLYYFFSWIYEKINSQKIGSAFPNINTDILKNTLMPLPPLAEQKRIVEKLEQLLPLCERLK